VTPTGEAGIKLFVSITTAQIRNVIEKEDDFGHEMRVGNILSNVTYPNIQFEETFVMRPSHGGTYEDPVTQKTRQFDYRCQIVRGRERLENIFLAVECKNIISDLPLVVCGRPRTDDESYHVFIRRGDDGKSSMVRQVDGLYSIYRPDCFVGKSLVRLKKKQGELCSDGDSEIYDKWSQALASSHELAFGAVYHKPRPKSCAFVVPLVVVPDNALWSLTYNENGEIAGDPEQVNQCEYYVDQKLLIGLPFVLTHIHFVTLKGLSELLSAYVARNARIWDVIFNEVSTEFIPAGNV
jgi:hypothetical protein